MQTFLPYPSFYKSLECLDSKRLGKQRVEASQILKALKDPTYGWQNHPAVKMWRGHEGALIDYYNTSLICFAARGHKNIILQPMETGSIVLPYWFGKEVFHASHRSNLLRKNPGFYSKYNWLEPPTLEYYWPV